MASLDSQAICIKTKYAWRHIPAVREHFVYASEILFFSSIFFNSTSGLNSYWMQYSGFIKQLKEQSPQYLHIAARIRICDPLSKKLLI